MYTKRLLTLQIAAPHRITVSSNVATVISTPKPNIKQIDLAILLLWSTGDTKCTSGQHVHFSIIIPRLKQELVNCMYTQIDCNRNEVLSMNIDHLGLTSVEAVGGKI